MNLFMRKVEKPMEIGLLVFEMELLGRKAVKHCHDCINYYSLLSTLVWKELANCSVGFPDVH